MTNLDMLIERMTVTTEVDQYRIDLVLEFRPAPTGPDWPVPRALLGPLYEPPSYRVTVSTLRSALPATTRAEWAAWTRSILQELSAGSAPAPAIADGSP